MRNDMASDSITADHVPAMNYRWLSGNAAFYHRSCVAAIGFCFLLPLFNAAPVGAAEVQLVKNGGVFEVPVRVNGVITLNFIIDSGSASVQIPADVALTLLRTGTISEEDFLPGAVYTLADGTRVTSPRFMLRRLEIAGHTVSNVEASIGSVEGSLLLGQSMLNRFATWSLDNRRHLLILGDSPSTPRKSAAKSRETPPPPRKPAAKARETPPPSSSSRQPIW